MKIFLSFILLILFYSCDNNITEIKPNMPLSNKVDSTSINNYQISISQKDSIWKLVSSEYNLFNINISNTISIDNSIKDTIDNDTCYNIDTCSDNDPQWVNFNVFTDEIWSYQLHTSSDYIDSTIKR